MTAATAIALCGTFISCTHDDITTGNGKINVVENYETAFISRFGQPGANQDWGFGSSLTNRVKTRAVSNYNGYRGSLTPTEGYWENGTWYEKPYTFPSAPAASAYKSDVSGITYEGDLLNPWNSSVKVQNYNEVYNQSSFPSAIWVDANAPTLRFDRTETQKGIEVYIVGEVNFNEVYFCENIKVYLTKDSKLTLPGTDYSFGQNNVEIYVAKDAELVCNGQLQFSNSKLFNNGTVTAKTLDIAGNGQVYNSGNGVINIEGKVQVSNNPSILVNDGTMNVGSSDHPNEIELAGSGRVQNNAEMNIYGNTFISSNHAIWVNNGHWTTTYFYYIAGSFNVLNNCYLEVTEDFCMNFGDKQGTFKIDAGGGVLTKNFYGGSFEGKDQYGNYKNFQGGPFRVDMGSNAVFKVTETARLDATKQNGYGFHGVGDDYAVFTAKDIIKSLTGEANVTYAGKLYVSAETHFRQGYSGQYPYIKVEDGFELSNIYADGGIDFSTGKPDITIPQTPCRPGFDGDDDDTRTDVAGIRIIAEDLTVGENSDFDFNDVVFDVDWVSTTKAKITLVAAGGTLPLVIGVPEGQEDTEAGQENEVHHKFGVNTGTMVNIGNMGITVAKNNLPTFEVDGTFVEDNFPASCNSIRIAVRKMDKNGQYMWIELNAEKAKVASKMAVHKLYDYCTEREDIEDKYDKFPDWVKDSSVIWYW